jgi:AraC-like DNA-binding protein
MRLQEARRLMLGEDMDAASAGFRVGYDDPSYFLYCLPLFIGFLHILLFHSPGFAAHLLSA